MTTPNGLHLIIIWGCQKMWLKCWLCEMKATVEKAAFENTMEEAFSASHCPNCEEFRRFRDFSQGRPAVNLSEVGRRGEEGEGPKRANAKPMDAGWQATGCKGGLYHSAKVPPCKTRAFIWAVEEVWKCFEPNTHSHSLAHLHSQTITNHWQMQIDIIHHQQQQSLYYKALTNANKWRKPSWVVLLRTSDIRK